MEKDQEVRTYSRKNKKNVSAGNNVVLSNSVYPSCYNTVSRSQIEWKNATKNQNKSIKILSPLCKSQTESKTDTVEGESSSNITDDLVLDDYYELVHKELLKSNGSYINIMVPAELPLARQLNLEKYLQQLKLFDCRWSEGYLWITNRVERKSGFRKTKELLVPRVRKLEKSSEHAKAIMQQSKALLRRFSVLNIADLKNAISTIENQPVSILESALEHLSLDEVPSRSTETKSLSEHPAPRVIDSLDTSLLSTIFDFLDRLVVLKTCQLVRRAWKRASLVSYNFSVSSSITNRCLNFSLKENIRNVLDVPSAMEYLFPSGEFIGEGSFKQVFKVRHRLRPSEEAVSVMNLRHVSKFGNMSLVSEEINVSLMLSELVTMKKCPFFVETYQVYELRNPPPYQLWKTPKEKVPHFDNDNNVFIYSNMELCDGGDLENFLKFQENEILSDLDTRNVLFQMLFALYIGQREVCLRHFDVKLLNFFVKSLDWDTLNKSFCTNKLKFRLPPTSDAFREKQLIIKLADYGTADTSPDTLHSRVTSYQFTTLENTPIEFLLFADSAQQYSADVFALGLSMLHLFTGSVPYEEILVEVTCPKQFKDTLRKLWRRKGFNSTVKSVLDEVKSDILFDTFYRYIVLFGLCEEDLETQQELKSKSAIFNEACKLFVGSAKGRFQASTAQTARDGFMAHQRVYSLKYGSHPLITRARSKLARNRGAEELIRSMTHYDPSCRRNVEELLEMEYFNDLREC